MAVVTLENIVKRYEGMGNPAVDDVNLTIEHGEFMVFLGPSGCGKSTTLRMIAGLEKITSGTLSIDGETMNNVSSKDRDIAMVFQSYALYPHMTVRNNLTFGLRRRRIPKPEIKSRVDAVAKILGLDGLLERKPFALSGGQRQRVALGRAIVRNPKVFLFDEPLSNLDAALRVRTRGELIKQHRRLGATMIYVTHDQVEAMTMGTRVCIMDQGRIVQVGQPLYIDEVASGDVKHSINLSVEVVTVEPLGAETILILETEAGEEIIARVGRDTQAVPGEKRNIIIDLAAVHLFDPSSTNVLSRSAELN